MPEDNHVAAGIALASYIASRTVIAREARDRFPYCRATESRRSYRHLLDATTTQVLQSHYIEWREFAEWREAIAKVDTREFQLKARSQYKN